MGDRIYGFGLFFSLMVSLFTMLYGGYLVHGAVTSAGHSVGDGFRVLGVVNATPVPKTFEVTPTRRVLLGHEDLEIFEKFRRSEFARS